MLYWLQHGDWPKYLADAPHHARGFVLEVMWQIIMGEDATMPDPKLKECKLYTCESRTAASTLVVPE